MIRLENVGKSYGNNLVLQGINLTVSNGEAIVVTGKNGSGKSTLLEIICNNISPDKGQVFFDGRQLKKNDFELRKKMGVLLQKSILIEELKVIDYLKVIAEIYGINHLDVEQKINDCLNLFLFDEKNLSIPIASCSTGQKKKIELCAAFIHDPQILILDEPFENIDCETASQLSKLVMEARTRNQIVIYTSHNHNMTKLLATRVLKIENNAISNISNSFL